MTDTPIWERLPTDTDKSFQAFCIYRDMGAKRSLIKTGQEYYGKSTVSLRYIEQWSVDHNWQERTSAYDAYQDTLRQARNIQRQKEIEDNAYADYVVLRQAIAKYINDYTALGFNGVKPHDISNLASLMKQADDYARRAVGLPDRITESSTSSKVDATVTKKPVSADELTDDELAAILAAHSSNAD